MATKITVTPNEGNAPKDIFTPGNLVISTNGVIVLVTQRRDSHNKFSAVCVFGNDIHKTGYHGEQWAIECFTQYKGTVTIVAE